MTGDFIELTEYLERKFRGLLDEKFGTLNQKISDLDNKLERLKENKADKSDINNLLNAVNDCAKKS